MAKEYLDFDEDYDEKSVMRKTKCFIILNKVTNDDLGQVKWNGAWRQYCFYPDPDTHWSRGCLKEVYDFIEKLTFKHLSQNVNKANSEEKNENI